MRHFSCDLCGRDLTTTEGRFVLRLEIRAAAARVHEATTNRDDDAMETMADLLNEMESASAGDLALPDDHRTQTMEYDLCPACRTRFAADPLGRDHVRKLRFSPN